MQTVQDWLTQKASDTPQPSGGLKSVSEWISTQPPTLPVAPATPPVPTEPSFMDKAVTKVKDYANESADVTRAFPDKLKHPVRSFMNFADTMKSEWMAGVTKAGTPIDNGNFITDISNLITGVAQASFSPVTALFKGAEAIPGIKQVADTINLPFVGLGLGGSFVAEKIVNALPDSVASKETKDVIMQPLQDLGALGAQLLLGGKIMERLGEISKTKKKGEKITVDEATKVIAEAKKELPVTEVTTQPKVMSVKEWQEAGMPKSPVKPALSEELMSKTEVAVKGEDGLIQEARKYKTAEEFVKAQGTPIYRGEGGSNVAQGKALLAEGKHFASDSKYPQGFGQVSENVIKPNAKILDLGDSTFAEISQKLGIPERRYISPKELSTIAKEKGYDVLKYNGEYKSAGKQFTHFVDLTGNSTISKSQLIDMWNKANGIKQPEAPIKLETKTTDPVQIEKANSRVYERMKNENPELTGDVKYTPISLKEDVARASDLLVKDRQEAFDIAMGKKSSPDVTSTSVNIVMAEKALQDGNIELFSRLTKKRSLDQTRRGQEIMSEKSSVSDNSVSRYVRELIETRLNILGNSYLGKAVEFVTKKSPKQKATKIIDNEVAKLTTKINSRKLDVKTALDLLDKLKCV